MTDPFWSSADSGVISYTMMYLFNVDREWILLCKSVGRTKE